MPSRRYQDPLASVVTMALLPTALLPPPLLRCRFRRRATPERREAIPTCSCPSDSTFPPSIASTSPSSSASPSAVTSAVSTLSVFYPIPSFILFSCIPTSPSVNRKLTLSVYDRKAMSLAADPRYPVPSARPCPSSLANLNCPFAARTFTFSTAFR